MIKNSAPDVRARTSKGMVFMLTKNKGGGVNPVSVLLALEIHNADRPGSRYGLNAG